MGHTSQRMTLRYAGIQADAKHRAVGLLAVKVQLSGATSREDEEDRTPSPTDDPSNPTESLGAGYGIRTRDLELGKLALYQLS